MHWIGHRAPAAEGLLLIASVSAAYLAVMPHILRGVAEAQQPTAFHVQNLSIQAGQRVVLRPLKLR